MMQMAGDNQSNYATQIVTSRAIQTASAEWTSNILPCKHREVLCKQNCKRCPRLMSCVKGNIILFWLDDKFFRTDILSPQIISTKTTPYELIELGVKGQVLFDRKVAISFRIDLGAQVKELSVPEYVNTARLPIHRPLTSSEEGNCKAPSAPSCIPADPRVELVTQ